MNKKKQCTAIYEQVCGAVHRCRFFEAHGEEQHECQCGTQFDDDLAEYDLAEYGADFGEYKR